MRVFPCALLSILLSPCLAVTSQPRAVAQQMPLRDAALPPTVQKDIIAALVADNKGSPDEPNMQEIALNSSVSFLALGRTGAPAIVVVVNGSSLCGNHGNCPSYLFMNENSRAVLIWQQDVGGGPKVEPAVHHGMHDISSSDVMNAGGEGSVEVEEFDGKTYKPAYCYEVKQTETGERQKSRHHPCG